MFRLLLMTLALTGAALGALAIEPEAAGQAGPATLADLEEKLRQHPEIAAYASRVEALGHYAKGELGLPDPMLFVEQEDYRLRSDMGRGGGDSMIGFRQAIPRPGLRRARGGLQAAESRKNRLLQDYAFAAMKARMIAALANLQKVNDQRAIASAQQKLLATQATSLTGSIAANRAEFSALALTSAEIAQTGILIAGLDQEQHEIEAMLTNMLGEAPNISLPPVAMTAWDENPASTYPVIIAASDIDMARKDVDIRKAEYGPNFEITASGGRMDGGDSGGSLMLGVSIPLWASQSQKPKLQGAQAALSAAQMDQHAIAREVTQKLMHLRAQIEAATRKLELLRHKQSLLQTAAAATIREYEAGKANFSMVLKARLETYSARLQAADERAKQTALTADFNRYIVMENAGE